jgi:predicted O-methyltransferase YrrM
MTPAVTHGDRTLEVLQTEWELEMMVKVCRAQRPVRILEVGAWEGGTLWHWLNSSAGTVVVVDDAMRNADLWQAWAYDAHTTLKLVQGRCENQDVVEQARKLGPYDLVFVDADHAYHAVKTDWENYSTMLAPGGAFAFHDIIVRPDYGVSILWEQIKAEPGICWMEIVRTPDSPDIWGGIGICWPDRT